MHVPLNEFKKQNGHVIEWIWNLPITVMHFFFLSLQEPII